MNTKNLENFQVIQLNTRFASDSLSEIPLNKWIDKSVGGCGLSYLALKDKNDSIIIMPRNKLIENKIQQNKKYPDLLAVNMGVGKFEIEKYIEKMSLENKPLKILITYNSFAMGKLDFLMDKNLRIYVDESQFLIEFATSEPKLVVELHKRLEYNIKRVTFFSAHPPKREYLPEYIQKIDAIKYTWLNQIKATPYIIDTDKPYLIITKILKSLLKDKQYTISNITFKKVIIFVNSVDGIRKIVEPLNSKKDIAYVVGDTVRNDAKLNDFCFPLEDCESLPLITIGTTTMISGIDLYDEETLNIIISSSSKEYTLFDKELDVPQAITRQRLDSNPHNDKFLFLISKSNMENKIIKLEETFINDLKKLKTVVENLNYLKQGNKDCSVGYELYDGYYFLNDEFYYVNEHLLKARKYVFEQLYKQYEEGYNVISTAKPSKVEINANQFYNKSYSQYVKDIQNCINLKERLNEVENVHVKQWKDYLVYGIENNKLLSNKEEAKEFYESRNDYKGIIISVRKIYKVGKFYSSESIKKDLQEIYDKKKLNRKAKSTDLYEFFEIENTIKRIEGKVVKGIIIKSNK